MISLNANPLEEPKAPAEAAKPAALPVGFVQQPTPSALCLNPETPMDNAQAILSLRAWHARDQMPIWRYWQKSFWQWHNGCWLEVDDDTVTASIWHGLNAADKRVKHYKLRFEPKPADVSATIAALKAAVNLPTDKAMPGWFGDDQPDGDLRELVACANGILHIPTRTLIKHTPKFWSPNILDFDFDPDARAERFELFLREIWPGDREAQECLTELYGLCLTDVTEFQKCFMFVGPPRGGRGTMGRVLRGLIGAQNYVGTSLKRFGEPFGMESFIGKKVAVFSDATLDGLSPRPLANIVEQTKQITGEDEIDINRKNRRYWHGKLNARLVFFCNELLRLEDQSGAMAERMLVYRMLRTIPKDKRDTKLTDKLLAERSGILNLALDGWDRVRSRGWLRQPASGLEMSELCRTRFRRLSLRRRSL
jgi:putative DNA primase/helicase